MMIISRIIQGYDNFKNIIWSLMIIITIKKFKKMIKIFVRLDNL